MPDRSERPAATSSSNDLLNVPLLKSAPVVEGFNMKVDEHQP